MSWQQREVRTMKPYGEAQWQTKAWALGIFPIGMAVVRAATEKLNRKNTGEKK